jgi:phosphohistidine phosphatase SixA
MRWLGLVALLAVAWASPAHAQKLVFVVRHAERADATMKPEKDPLLSEAGKARAEKLAKLLADSGVNAVVVTEFVRTQETAKPLATKLGLKPELLPAKDTAAMVAKLKEKHATDTVLVVGHSNTVPDIVAAYGGPAFKLGDDEYDNLFVIVPATKTVTRLRF